MVFQKISFLLLFLEPFFHNNVVLADFCFWFKPCIFGIVKQKEYGYRINSNNGDFYVDRLDCEFQAKE